MTNDWFFFRTKNHGWGVLMKITDLEAPFNLRCVGLIVFLMVWRSWMLFPVLWPEVGSLNISYRVRYIVLYCSWKEIIVFVTHYTIHANFVRYTFITSKRIFFHILQIKTTTKQIRVDFTDVLYQIVHYKYFNGVTMERFFQMRIKLS